MCIDCQPNNQTTNESETMNEYNPETIRAEFAEYAQQLAGEKPYATPRTWGFEIESNTMDRVKQEVISNHRLEFTDLDTILDFQQDGSVENYINDSCECSCDDCSHSCDCDNCGFDYDYLDHCGDCAGCEEVASVGGLFNTHPQALEMLANAGINKATFESDCGIHIHIASGDLTPAQVANIMTAYRLAQPIMTAIAERENTSYASNNTPDDENATRQGLSLGSKMHSVNTESHWQSHRTKTIEFRQMSAESVTDIPQTDRVRAWAMLQLSLIEYATKPAPQLYWISRTRNLRDLLRLLNS
jgi:hypothetical protein